jgi:hypothetical protein
MLMPENAFKCSSRKIPGGKLLLYMSLHKNTSLGLLMEETGIGLAVFKKNAALPGAKYASDQRFVK